MMKAGSSPWSPYGSRGTERRYRGGGVNLKPDELRKEIEDTLEELERVETEVMEFFADLGPDALRQVALYKEAQKHQPRVRALTPEEPPGPSTSPPETR